MPSARRHSRDQLHHTAHLPDVVVYPTEAERVAAVLRLANEAADSSYSWGSAPGWNRKILPLFGGVLLSLERMNCILHVYADDFQVVVQPGIGHKDRTSSLRVQACSSRPIQARMPRWAACWPTMPPASGRCVMARVKTMSSRCRWHWLMAA